MIERFERFSHAIFAVSRYWHQLAAEEMEPYSLKGPHAIYLVAILRSTQGLTCAQLCELSGRDKADVSRAISLMESKGLVRRQCNGTNLYRAQIFLTEQGVQAAEHICQRASLAVEYASSGYTEEERNIFWQVLDTIAGNLQNMTKTGIPHKENAE